MTTAELKKHFNNIIKYHFGYDLWNVRADLPYRKAIEPFLNDLVRIARCHKKGLSIELYKINITNIYDSDDESK